MRNQFFQSSVQCLHLNHRYSKQLDSKTELKSGKFLIKRSQSNTLQPHSHPKSHWHSPTDTHPLTWHLGNHRDCRTCWWRGLSSLDAARNEQFTKICGRHQHTGVFFGIFFCLFVFQVGIFKQLSCLQIHLLKLDFCWCGCLQLPKSQEKESKCPGKDRIVESWTFKATEGHPVGYIVAESTSTPEQKDMKKGYSVNCSYMRTPLSTLNLP